LKIRIIHQVFQHLQEVVFLLDHQGAVIQPHRQGVVIQPHLQGVEIQPHHQEIVISIQLSLLMKLMHYLLILRQKRLHIKILQ